MKPPIGVFFPEGFRNLFILFNTEWSMYTVRNKVCLFLKVGLFGAVGASV